MTQARDWTNDRLGRGHRRWGAVGLAIGVAALAVLPSAGRAAGPGTGSTAGAVGTATTPSAADRLTPTLAPHEAVYTLALATTEPGGVVGARGKMTYRLEHTCAGWTMETRTALDVSYAEGGELDTLWEYVAYESRDGSDFSFFIRNTHNGTVDEVLEGEVGRAAPSGPLVARFRRPDADSLSLAADTLFPNAHTLAMLTAAARGDRLLVRSVFDGASTAGGSLVSAVIGRPLAADAPGELDHPLLHTPSWRMAVAFFSPEDEEEPGHEGIPTYEVAVRYHLNGVAQDMVQDFGRFSLASHLVRLVALPEPDC